MTVRPEHELRSPQDPDGVGSIVAPFPSAPAMARRAATALRLAGAPGARRPPVLQRLGRDFLDRLGARLDLYLAKGMSHPYAAVRPRRFTRDAPLRVHLDYVRFATTELHCRQIVAQELPGCVGEVGVDQGWWARAVNHHLPDRPLYLFDTFAGFDPRDLAGQERLGLSTEAPYVVGGGTSERVLRSLPHPERAVIRQGWFPETARGLEDERFCLVDIDTGLYDPTLAALRWFYPRTVPRGYVTVVDYNNRHTPGVKRAVDTFAEESGAAFSLLPDSGAAAVFVRPGVSSAKAS